MERYCLLFLFVFLIVYASGQKSKVFVILKNGSIIKGRIVELTSGNYKIESKKNIWNFTKSEIDTVKYKMSKNRTHPVLDIPYAIKLDAGVLLGN